MSFPDREYWASLGVIIDDHEDEDYAYDPDCEG